MTRSADARPKTISTPWRRELGVADAHGDGGRLARGRARVDADIASARASGVRVHADVLHQRPPLRRAVGRSSLADAMLGSLGHRVQSAARRLRELGAVDRRAAAADVDPRGVARQLADGRRLRRVLAMRRSASRSADARFRMSLLHWVNDGAADGLLPGRRARDQARVHGRPPREPRAPPRCRSPRRIGGMAVPAALYCAGGPAGAVDATAGACRWRPTPPSRSR